MNNLNHSLLQQDPTKTRLALVDLTRVLLALLILSCHMWAQLSMHLHQGADLSAGYIACEPFFALSGFFLAAKAYKSDPLPWYRYTWRRIYDYVPVFIVGILAGFLGFSIASLVVMEPYVHPINNLFHCAWFMLWLFISSAILYPIFCKCKDKFIFPAIFLAIGLYIGLYFLDGHICNNNPLHSEHYWTIIRKFARSMAGLIVGGFIFACSRRIKNHQIYKGFRITFSFLAMIVILSALFVHFVYTRCEFDFVVIILFDTFLFIVLTNIGYLSNKIVLPANVCLMFRQISYISYVVHWAPVGMMMVFGFKNPSLLNEKWYLGLYGIVCYSSSIAISFACDRAQKWLKKQVFNRIPKLSTI